MAAAEVAPLAKVGGLGDVLGSLPPAVKSLGVDARVIMPLYGSISPRKHDLNKIYSDLEVPSGRLLMKVNVWQGKLPHGNVPVYFIDCPEYFGKPEVYCGNDNAERFLFFSLAALYALPVLGWQPDIIHCHDSHTALMPDIIKTTNLEYLRGLKTIFTIHNFYYQGKAEQDVLTTGNLHPESLKSLSVDLQDGDVNFMVQGVLNADLVTTVSPTYAREITTSAYGARLDNVIRKRRADLYGIINGLDLEYYDPSHDPAIAERYTAKSINKKLENKLALQKKLGLPVNQDIPLVAMVTRLVWQKGIDLVTTRFSRFRAQFVFLGTGKPEYERSLKELGNEHPEQFSVNLMYDEKLAKLIYAGADIFLMPSRFEPCGLGQMIAMRYGTVPVVRATGGLKDTVTPDLGFSFKDVSKDEFYKSIKQALDTYYDRPDDWRAMQTRGMQADFSWDKPAKEYVGLYKKLMLKQ